MASQTLFLAAFLLILVFSFTESTGNTSQWLAGLHRRQRGCRVRPWICLHGGDRSVKCCRNMCVDVGSDRNNCGRCGIQCPFAWHCYHGECINVARNPYHCGSCDTQCPLRVCCRYKMCGYGDSSLPSPSGP